MDLRPTRTPSMAETLKTHVKRSQVLRLNVRILFSFARNVKRNNKLFRQTLARSPRTALRNMQV